ncbi:MAG: EAL domain-containing protein [Granulosicoccus sp.]
MKISFYKRVLLLLCTMLLLVQLGNLSAVLTTIGQDVRQQLRDELTAGSELTARLAQQRSDLLTTSAEVLAADFGFRSAIASNDRITIQSALNNNLARIDADLATFISLDGGQYGNTEAIAEDIPTYTALLKIAESEDVVVDTVMLNGRPKQVVAVPIKVPLPIGWLILGFALDDNVARSFSDQVGMHVTFAHGDSRFESFGSTLPENLKESLPTAMLAIHESDRGQISTLEHQEFLTGIVALGYQKAPVVALLHSSLDEAMASYYAVRNRLLLYMGIGLFFVMTLGFWFARGVTRPVKSLADAAIRIRNGDYKTELKDLRDAQRGDEFGELISVFGEMQDGIAEREATILHQALFDELTGLPNRRQAQDRLEAHFNCETTDINAVILIGLNRYRQIVETLGHNVGESVVKALSERLKESVVDARLIARVSTDEFIVLLSFEADSDAMAYAQALIPELLHPIRLEQAELVPDLSAGVVVLPDDAHNSADAMRRASIALADARENNTNTCRYEIGRDESYIRRLSIVADLKKAVEQDQLILHFQPKINMATGATTSVEALVRWIHPTHGFMPPDEFISLAEQSGNIGMLTQWVLNAVIAQIHEWSKLGIPLKAAVNLSALDLLDESLFARIEALLIQHDVPASHLIIEVTESAMLRDTHQALITLKRMRKRGLTISIDDFGTGYSSLAKLKDLPIDELKIDRAFVTDVKPNTAKAKILKAIIDLGHSIGLTVITEGVETKEEWDLLAILGNDIVQGYLISRPLPAADLTKWWNERYPNQLIKVA